MKNYFFTAVALLLIFASFVSIVSVAPIPRKSLTEVRQLMTLALIFVYSSLSLITLRPGENVSSQHTIVVGWIGPHTPLLSLFVQVPVPIVIFSLPPKNGVSYESAIIFALN
jgi:hypothetical protein